jgi:hypothetical protein
VSTDGRIRGTQQDNDLRDKVRFLYKYFKFSVKTQSKRIKEQQTSNQNNVQVNRSEIERSQCKSEAKRGLGNGGCANMQLPKGLVVLVIT